MLAEDAAKLNAMWGETLAAPKKLAYVHKPGELTLSFSREEKLRRCPREFYLDEVLNEKKFEPSAHTAFGHAFAAGVQEYCAYYDDFEDKEALRERALVMAMASWSHPNLWDTVEKDDKSVETALLGVDIFIRQAAPEIMREYRIAEFDGRKGVELFVYVQLADGYNYQMHIDLVMQHRESGEYVVFEIKSKNRESIMEDWKNSDQALGYNVALQSFLKQMRSQLMYRVLYLCYSTTDRSVMLLPFELPVHVRAEWIVTKLFTVNTLQMYKDYNVWPKNGKSCMRFKKHCPHFNTCDLVRRAAQPFNEESAYENVGMDAVDYATSLQKISEAFS